MNQNNKFFMSDKNKKLVDQAKQFAIDQMSHHMIPTMFSAEVFQNKLIELVVADCMMICGSVQDADKCKELITDNFGITL